MARIFYHLYGYEGLNILFRIIPSSFIILILRKFGASVGKGVRILSPFYVHNGDRIKPIFSNLFIGDDVFIGRRALFDLAGKITICDKVTISHDCAIHTHTDAGKSPLGESFLMKTKGNVLINHGAYLGARVTLLEGVCIGNLSIVAAGSVVLIRVPDKSLVAGVPARIKKYLS